MRHFRKAYEARGTFSYLVEEIALLHIIPEKKGAAAELHAVLPCRIERPINFLSGVLSMHLFMKTEPHLWRMSPPT